MICRIEYGTPGHLKQNSHIDSGDDLVSPANKSISEPVSTNILEAIWSLQWRHNKHDGVSNHQPHDCLLKRLFMRWSKKPSKLRVTGLCEGNSPVTDEFYAERASNAENVSIWWRHNYYTIVLWWWVCPCRIGAPCRLIRCIHNTIGKNGAVCHHGHPPDCRLTLMNADKVKKSVVARDNKLSCLQI